jgi:CRISPR-associated protein Csb2
MSAFFTGHSDNGAPVRRADSSHIAFAFAAASKRLLVIGPHILERREPTENELKYLRTLDEALDGFRDLLAGNAGHLRLLSSSIDESNDPLFGRSTEWETSTPYVVTRHAKRHNPQDVLAIDLRAECRRVGLPEPQVEVRDAHGIPGVGLVGTARMRFNVAVAGPIMLGRDRYLGGGLFQCYPA